MRLRSATRAAVMPTNDGSRSTSPRTMSTNRARKKAPDDRTHGTSNALQEYMLRHARTLVLLLVLIASTGCTAAGYAANRVPDVPSNAVEISTDAIKAPSDMGHACGDSSYTVDSSTGSPFRNTGDRDVVFHCDDGSKPSVNN
jgi:hypothetical protein